MKIDSFFRRSRPIDNPFIHFIANVYNVINNVGQPNGRNNTQLMVNSTVQCIDDKYFTIYKNVIYHT